MWVTLISLCAMILVSDIAQAQRESAERPAAARISQRLARVARDRSGALVVVEILQVRLGPESPGGDSLTALPLLELPATASQVQLVGGDLSPGQLTRFDGAVGVLGPFPTPRFGVAISYTLPAGAESIPLSAGLPVDTLLVDVARGSVEARPDPILRRQDSGGGGSRPRMRYRAENLAPSRVVRLRLDRSPVDWRHRFAVFMTSTLAAGAAGLWVWRGSSPTLGRRRPTPQRPR